MKRRRSVLAVLTIVLLVSSGLAKEPKKKAKEQSGKKSKASAHAETPKSVSKTNKDHAEILRLAKSYTAAFNAGNSKALAQHWSENSVYVIPDTDERITGRDAIQKQFAAMFAEKPAIQLEITIKSIRNITDEVAVEEGVARLVSEEGEVSDSTYTAIHIKEKGQWQIDSVRETLLPTPEPTPSNNEQLQGIAWMIGEWIDESEDSVIETSCEWTKNGNFMTRSFKASVQGEIELEGTQVIGWDAASNTIRSWVFDSDGGFGSGTWEQKGNQWLVKSNQVLANGSLASSVNIFTQVDDDSFTWQSIGRQIDGEFLPNVKEVTIVRKK